MSTIARTNAHSAAGTRPPVVRPRPIVTTAQAPAASSGCAVDFLWQGAQNTISQLFSQSVGCITSSYLGFTKCNWTERTLQAGLTASLVGTGAVILGLSSIVAVGSFAVTGIAGLVALSMHDYNRALENAISKFQKTHAELVSTKQELEQTSQILVAENATYRGNNERLSTLVTQMEVELSSLRACNDRLEESRRGFQAEFAKFRDENSTLHARIGDLATIASRMEAQYNESRAQVTALHDRIVSEIAAHRVQLDAHGAEIAQLRGTLTSLTGSSGPRAFGKPGSTGPAGQRVVPIRA